MCEQSETQRPGTGRGWRRLENSETTLSQQSFCSLSKLTRLASSPVSVIVKRHTLYKSV